MYKPGGFRMPRGASSATLAGKSPARSKARRYRKWNWALCMGDLLRFGCPGRGRISSSVLNCNAPDSNFLLQGLLAGKWRIDLNLFRSCGCIQRSFLKSRRRLSLSLTVHPYHDGILSPLSRKSPPPTLTFQSLEWQDIECDRIGDAGPVWWTLNVSPRIEFGRCVLRSRWKSPAVSEEHPPLWRKQYSTLTAISHHFSRLAVLHITEAKSPKTRLNISFHNLFRFCFRFVQLLLTVLLKTSHDKEIRGFTRFVLALEGLILFGYRRACFCNFDLAVIRKMGKAWMNKIQSMQYIIH